MSEQLSELDIWLNEVFFGRKLEALKVEFPKWPEGEPIFWELDDPDGEDAEEALYYDVQRETQKDGSVWIESASYAPSYSQPWQLSILLRALDERDIHYSLLGRRSYGYSATIIGTDYRKVEGFTSYSKESLVEALALAIRRYYEGG